MTYCQALQAHNAIAPITNVSGEFVVSNRTVTSLSNHTSASRSSLGHMEGDRKPNQCQFSERIRFGQVTFWRRRCCWA